MRRLSHRSPAAAATDRVAQLELTVGAQFRQHEADRAEIERLRAALALTRACVHSAAELPGAPAEVAALWRDVDMLTRRTVAKPELAGAVA